MPCAVPVASGSSSDSLDNNALIILMPDGFSFTQMYSVLQYTTPRQWRSRLERSPSYMRRFSARVRISAATDLRG